MTLSSSIPSVQALVLGGGPAGSSAAATLASSGVDTLLVDKSAFPRQKLCGGLLTLRSQRRYEQIFSQPWDGAFEERRYGLRLLHENTLLNAVDSEHPLCFTQRRHFDHYLLRQAAERGARLQLGDGVQSIDLAQRICTLRSGTRIAYDHLIGCDGVNSVAARAVFGRSFDPQGIGFAMETDIPRAQLNRAVTDPEIHFDVVRWGYAWVFPKREVVTIGLGGLMRRNGDMRPLLARFIEQTTGLREGYRLQGHHIPFGDVRRTPGAGTVLLAGDAAGLVDPITGEGIAFAMESGQRAAQAVADALRGGEAALPRYTRELQGAFQAIGHGRALRHLFFPAPMEKLFLRLVPGSHTLTRLHMDLLAGAVEYPAYTRRVVQRLVPGLLRLVRR